MSASTPLLEVRDLRTTFKVGNGDLRAVDGVSFAVDAGTTLGIVGESGSGKTVLARSILRLVASRRAITTGSVQFAGRELLELSDRRMRRVWGREASMIFQDSLTALTATMTVGAQLGEPLREHLGLRGAAATDRSIELLDLVGIPGPKQRLRAYPHQLSGGMRQRVMIAIALACDPKLVVADEPTTALDVTVQRQILDLLASRQRESGMAMVLITHDLGVVAGRTDHIMVMYAGRVVESAPTIDLFDECHHPYTDGLLHSIPRLSDPSNRVLDAIPGRPPELTHPSAGCRFAPRCPNAQRRCLAESPELEQFVAGNQAACFFPVNTPRGNEARKANEAAGVTAAGRPMSTFAGEVASVT